MLMLIKLSGIFSLTFSVFVFAQGNQAMTTDAVTDAVEEAVISQQSGSAPADSVEKTVNAENSTEANAASSKADRPKEKFIPSEEISEDKPVSFPVDI